MKKRVVAAKALALGAGATAAVSHHIYAEDSVVDLVLEISGYSLLVVAALGRVWSSVFIIGKKTTNLVTEGPYATVRNPLYFFSLLGFVGVGLAFESLALAFLFGLVFLITHWPTILQEEKKLAGIYGEEFRAYCKTVPRLIPNVALLRYPTEVAFSPKVFSRALADSFMLLGAFMAAHLVEWAHLHHYLPVYFHLY